MTTNDIYHSLMVPYRVDDDDDPEDEDDDLDGDEDDEDDDDEDPDVETWQVTDRRFPLKYGMCLTSGAELPRLAPNLSAQHGLDRFGRPRVPTGS